MAYAPGHLPASALTEVQTGIFLAKPTATRYRALKAAAKSKLGRTISVAQPAGGYRSASVQNAMHLAGSAEGTRAERARWGLNESSTVAIAAHPDGTHETGTRLDVVGTPIDAAFVALARTFGFVLELKGDPNHFVDLGTWRITVAATVKGAVASKKVTVVVRSGDTLTKIAAAHSTAKARLSVGKVLSLNPAIKDPDRIRVGQKIRIA